MFINVAIIVMISIQFSGTTFVEFNIPVSDGCYSSRFLRIYIIFYGCCFFAYNLRELVNSLRHSASTVYFPETCNDRSIVTTRSAVVNVSTTADVLVRVGWMAPSKVLFAAG